MARHEDSDEDTYATVGTPFEVLETDEDVQKAKERKEKEQYVTDSQGRRRFHGAFTGGFSAGYYNTVGSKEGWAPSTFHSSREKKSQYVGQKPEDFMDEEDLGAGGIAPREITTSSQFSQKGAGFKRPHPLDSSHPSVIPGEAPLQNLIVPAKSSIGARLLQSMGWREGQGVGPRVQRYSTPAPKIYSCSLPHQSATVSSSEETAPGNVYGFWFAPRDIRPWEFEGRDDLHGIGYSGMEDREVLGRREMTRALYGMKGEAFGIGALEEEDTEDNVYGEEAMTSYHATLAGEGDLDMERKFGWTGGSEDSWSLASFARATKPRPKLKVYPSPDVPRDFVPIHRFSILNIKAADGQEQQSKPVTVAERSQLLADTPGSVFSLLSPEDRDRLKRAAEVAQQPAAASNVQRLLPTTHHHPPTTNTKPHPLATPTFSPTTTLPIELSSQAQQQSTLSSLPVEDIKPFVHDPAKQARYEAFLGGKRLHADPVSVGMTEWERQREREEFSRTARVYQPLSVSLSSRFTRAEDAEKSKKSESPEPDSVQAARANLFGVLTREVVEWHPHRVLCRRFNVPDPYPNSGVVGVASDREQRTKQVKHIQFLTTEKMGAGSGKDSGKESSGYPKDDSEGTSLQAVKRDSLPAFDEPVKDDREESIKDSPSDAKEKERENTEEEEEQADAARPPMDLFKAIFAESSAESDISSDAETETEISQMNIAGSHGNQETAPGNQSSSTSQERIRRTRWQDLSEVATKVLPVTTTTRSPSVGGSGLAERHTAVPAASSTVQMEGRMQRKAVQNGGTMAEKGAAAVENRSPEVFGPILPPGFDPDSINHSGSERSVDGSGGGGGRKRKEEAKHKHKHKHHKMPRREKSDRKEGHSHRRKEKKKTRHKQ